MFTKENIESLKNQLIKVSDNYIGEVAAKANLSRPTVSKFFNFQKIRSANATKVYDATLALIKSYKREQQSRIKQTMALIDEEDTAQ